MQPFLNDVSLNLHCAAHGDFIYNTRAYYYGYYDVYFIPMGKGNKHHSDITDTAYIRNTYVGIISSVYYAGVDLKLYIKYDVFPSDCRRSDYEQQILLI